MDEEWKGKQAEMAAKFKADRDAELDRVVAKLEGEVAKEKRTIESDVEEKLTKMRNRLDEELKTAEDEVKSLREKMLRTREDAAKTEEELIVLKATLKQRDLLIDELQKVTNAHSQTLSLIHSL